MTDVIDRLNLSCEVIMGDLWAETRNEIIRDAYTTISSDMREAATTLAKQAERIEAARKACPCDAGVLKAKHTRNEHGTLVIQSGVCGVCTALSTDSEGR